MCAGWVLGSNRSMGVLNGGQPWISCLNPQGHHLRFEAFGIQNRGMAWDSKKDKDRERYRLFRKKRYETIAREEIANSGGS